MKKKYIKSNQQIEYSYDKLCRNLENVLKGIISQLDSVDIYGDIEGRDFRVIIYLKDGYDYDIDIYTEDLEYDENVDIYSIPSITRGIMQIVLKTVDKKYLV